MADLPQPKYRKERYLYNIASGTTSELPQPKSREERYLYEIASNGGGGGGTTNYNQLSNKPKINNVELSGNKSASDLSIYTRSEVDDIVEIITTMNVAVVQTLPIEDISTTTIYLVPKADAETDNVYDEYLYVSNAWELIGNTEIDLTNYVQKNNVFNYSTTEQVVGTWIDEKPIYQKTITGTANLAQMPNYSSIGTTSALISSDIDNIIDVLITGKGTGTGYQGFQSPASYAAYVNIGGNINVGQGIASGTTEIAYRITVQYTKTTD